MELAYPEFFTLFWYIARVAFFAFVVLAVYGWAAGAVKAA